MNTTMRPISVIFLFTGFASAAVAQAPAKPVAGLPPKVPAVIATASASASEDLTRSLGKLGEVQAGIQKEKDPLNKELQAREAALRDLQEALDPLLMEVNQSELDITNLRAANKLSADENQVVSNILDEYARGCIRLKCSAICRRSTRRARHRK